MILIFLFTLAVHAGTEVLNGGNAIVLRDSEGKILKARLYDYHEGGIRGIVPNIPGETVEQKLKILFERLARISPERAKMYAGQFLNFEQDRGFINEPLAPQNDLNPISIPVGYKIEQLALQRRPIFPQDKHFYINEEIWQALDADNRAGLILHELIYREAIGFGHTSSTYVRYFNSLIAADRLPERASDQEIFNFYGLLNFPRFDIRGFFLDLLNCRVYDAGYPQCVFEREILYYPTMFYPNGKVQLAKYLMEPNRKYPIAGTDVWISGESGKVPALTVEFFPSGSVLRMQSVSDYERLYFSLQGQHVIADHSLIGLNFSDAPDSYLRCFRSEMELQLKSDAEVLTPVAPGAIVFLDKRGLVTRIVPADRQTHAVETECRSKANRSILF
jgi:hypothetical protein